MEGLTATAVAGDSAVADHRRFQTKDAEGATVVMEGLTATAVAGDSAVADHRTSG